MHITCYMHILNSQVCFTICINIRCIKRSSQGCLNQYKYNITHYKCSSQWCFIITCIIMSHSALQFTMSSTHHRDTSYRIWYLVIVTVNIVSCRQLMTIYTSCSPPPLSRPYSWNCTPVTKGSVIDIQLCKTKKWTRWECVCTVHTALQDFPFDGGNVEW